MISPQNSIVFHRCNRKAFKIRDEIYLFLCVFVNCDVSNFPQGCSGLLCRPRHRAGLPTEIDLGGSQAILQEREKNNKNHNDYNSLHAFIFQLKSLKRKPLLSTCSMIRNPKARNEGYSYVLGGLSEKVKEKASKCFPRFNELKKKKK